MAADRISMNSRACIQVCAFVLLAGVAAVLRGQTPGVTAVANPGLEDETCRIDATIFPGPRAETYWGDLRAERLV